MVVAVGDERCQRVHVMRVLDNRNLVGLQEREDGLGTEAKETACTPSCHSLAECAPALCSAAPYPTLITGLERRRQYKRMREAREPPLWPRTVPLHRCSEVPVGCSVLTNYIISMDGRRA